MTGNMRLFFFFIYDILSLRVFVSSKISSLIKNLAQHCDSSMKFFCRGHGLKLERSVISGVLDS